MCTLKITILSQSPSVDGRCRRHRYRHYQSTSSTETKAPSQSQMTVPPVWSGKWKWWWLVVMRLSILGSPISVILEHFMRLFYYNCYFIEANQSDIEVSSLSYSPLLSLPPPHSEALPLCLCRSIGPESSVCDSFSFSFIRLLSMRHSLLSHKFQTLLLVNWCVCVCARVHCRKVKRVLEKNGDVRFSV